MTPPGNRLSYSGPSGIAQSVTTHLMPVQRPINRYSSLAKTKAHLPCVILNELKNLVVPAFSFLSSLYVFANSLTESEADYKKGTRKERLSGSSPLSGGAGEIEAFAGPLSLTVILDAGPRRLKSGIEYRSLFF